MGILDARVVRRIRQHHAVEHATITILMRREQALHLVGGRSNHLGFYIYGAVETAALQAAAQEALMRLQRGEAGLAIHPNCGTNLIATGTLTGLAVFITTTISRWRRRSILDQVPASILAATAALLAGRPFGTLLQARVTTLADVANLRLGAINRRKIGRWTHHFVALEEVDKLR